MHVKILKKKCVASLVTTDLAIAVQHLYVSKAMLKRRAVRPVSLASMLRAARTILAQTRWRPDDLKKINYENF